VAPWFSITVMIICGMAKKPKPRKPPAPPAKRPRGRPPKPGGPKPQAEIQRAYRERLAAAGKVVKLVDAALFDPGAVGDMRERLRNAVLEVERRRDDVARLEARNAYLERELKLQEQHLTNTFKEVITLKQQLAKKKPAKRR
jgi:hypothetical protein